MTSERPEVKVGVSWDGSGIELQVVRTDGVGALVTLNEHEARQVRDELDNAIQDRPEWRARWKDENGICHCCNFKLPKHGLHCPCGPGPDNSAS